MTSTHATRALRAAVFTALAVPMAALGQVVITGRPLPLSLVATASAVVFLVSAVLAGGERRLLHISAVMVPVELLLNTTFNLGQTGCGPVLSEHVSARGVNLLVCGGGSVDGSLLGAPLGHAGQLAPAATQLLLLLVHLVIALAASAWLRLATPRCPAWRGHCARCASRWPARCGRCSSCCSPPRCARCCGCHCRCLTTSGRAARTWC